MAGSLGTGTTYGLTVVGNADSVSGGYRLGLGDGSYYAAGSGDGANFSNSSVSMFSELTSGGSALSADFAFIANSAPGFNAFAPVPEASTVAVLFAGAFVSLMVGVRIRQRRLQAELPVQAELSASQ